MLGVLIVLDSIVPPGVHVGELVLGLLVLGVIPLDVILDRLRRNGNHR